MTSWTSSFIVFSCQTWLLASVLAYCVYRMGKGEGGKQSALVPRFVYRRRGKRTRAIARRRWFVCVLWLLRSPRFYFPFQRSCEVSCLPPPPSSISFLILATAVRVPPQRVREKKTTPLGCLSLTWAPWKHAALVSTNPAYCLPALRASRSHAYCWEGWEVCHWLTRDHVAIKKWSDFHYQFLDKVSGLLRRFVWHESSFVIHFFLLLFSIKTTPPFFWFPLRDFCEREKASPKRKKKQDRQGIVVYLPTYNSS